MLKKPNRGMDKKIKKLIEDNLGMEKLLKNISATLHKAVSGGGGGGTNGGSTIMGGQTLAEGRSQFGGSEESEAQQRMSDFPE